MIAITGTPSSHRIIGIYLLRLVMSFYNASQNRIVPPHTVDARTRFAFTTIQPHVRQCLLGGGSHSLVRARCAEA